MMHKLKVLAEMQKLEASDSPFQPVKVDIFGPFPQIVLDNKYILAFGVFFRWSEAFSVYNITSDTIAGYLREFSGSNREPNSAV